MRMYVLKNSGKETGFFLENPVSHLSNPSLPRSYHEPRLTTKDENEASVRQDGILSHIYFRSSHHDPWLTTKGENDVTVIPSGTERSGVKSRNLAHTGTRFLDSLRLLEMTWERWAIFGAVE